MLPKDSSMSENTQFRVDGNFFYHCGKMAPLSKVWREGSFFRRNVFHIRRGPINSIFHHAIAVPPGNHAQERRRLLPGLTRAIKHIEYLRTFKLGDSLRKQEGFPLWTGKGLLPGITGSRFLLDLSSMGQGGRKSFQRAPHCRYVHALAVRQLPLSFPSRIGHSPD